jgi:hypothetical protein
MTAKRNAIAKDLRSPKYRPRVVKSKKAYVRRPKHPARAADGFRGMPGDLNLTQPGREIHTGTCSAR